MDVLRKNGWVFDVQGGNEAGWYKFYEYFGRQFALSLEMLIQLCLRLHASTFQADMGHFAYAIRAVSGITRPSALVCLLLCSLFFNILHPPLNVPALCESLMTSARPLAEP